MIIDPPISLSFHSAADPAGFRSILMPRAAIEGQTELLELIHQNAKRLFIQLQPYPLNFLLENLNKCLCPACYVWAVTNWPILQFHFLRPLQTQPQPSERRDNWSSNSSYLPIRALRLDQRCLALIRTLLSLLNSDYGRSDVNRQVGSLEAFRNNDTHSRTIKSDILINRQKGSLKQTLQTMCPRHGSCRTNRQTKGRSALQLDSIVLCSRDFRRS
jgi:hypothetical protein